MTWLVEKKTYRFTRPFKTATQAFHSREVIEVRDLRSPGGLGEAAPLSGWGATGSNQLFGELQDFAKSGAPLRSACARFAVDSARMDREARLEAVPLWRLLAERFDLEPSTAVYLNGTIAGGDGYLEEAEHLVNQGFGCLKMKVGILPVEQDLQRVRAVRERFPGAQLRLDANGAWSVQEAIQALEGLKNLGIDYVEQPCAGLQELVQLRGIGVRLALDESIVDAADFELALDSNLVDVFVLKPAQIGSFEEIVGCVRAAEQRGLECVFSSSLDSIGRFVAAHLARALGLRSPCGLATGSWLYDHLTDPLIPDKHGMIWGFSEGCGLDLPEERYV